MGGLISSDKIFNDAIGIDRYLRLNNKQKQDEYDEKVAKRKKASKELLAKLMKNIDAKRKKD